MAIWLPQQDAWRLPVWMTMGTRLTQEKLSKPHSHLAHCLTLSSSFSPCPSLSYTPSISLPPSLTLKASIPFVSVSLSLLPISPAFYVSLPLPPSSLPPPSLPPAPSSLSPVGPWVEASRVRNVDVQSILYHQLPSSLPPSFHSLSLPPLSPVGPWVEASRVRNVNVQSILYHQQSAVHLLRYGQQEADAAI